MKRLGAGIRDAEEIKEHEFFANVNWEEVFQRKIVLPKPEPREIKPADIPLCQIFNDYTVGNAGVEDENKLPGWSFVTPDVTKKAARTQ